ncbi:MAG TPA: mechanosensitive ion channel domain-containing protein [Candidatus Eremiobacteraceae bacterium]|nr:mechanosensitive ion channel domain-containing protein [Candidatus Eremiobacteraceae bacterium]
MAADDMNGMKTTRKIVAFLLLGLLALVVYALYRTGMPAANEPEKPLVSTAGAAALVDESSLRTAQKLALLADKPEEQRLATEAIRLADHELDLAFAAAQRDAKAHPAPLSEEAKEIQARLVKAQSNQKQVQAEIAQLTAELARASGNNKQALQDRLEAAKAELELADDEVDDASQDLVRAGGDTKWRLEQLAEEHKATSASVDNAAPLKSVEAPERFGLIHRVTQWNALQQKRKQLVKAKQDETASAAALTARHNDLAARIETVKQSSPDLARHAKTSVVPSQAESAKQFPTKKTPTKGRSHEESVAALANVKEIISQQQELAGLDRRADYRRQLAAIYGQWAREVAVRQSGVLHRALQGIVVILLIMIAAVFFSSWMNNLVSRLSMDRRQVQSLHTVVRVSLQIVGLLLILIVVLGPPNQLGTFLGLAGAGLTVALKDFIVGFIGWFVLMGKNGMRVGDWVEINGVTGEVVQVGPFHTVLLETGNWTDSGHPTGRRVTFTNSFAIEGHYFNFSTSGQWLWDELQVILPAGQDLNPMIAAIQKKVIEATQETAEQAKNEWSRSTSSREMGSISVAPAISVKPVVGGIEVSVRYVTRANERHALRSKLYQEAVELLGGRQPESPSAPSNPDQPSLASNVAPQEPKPAPVKG